MNKPSKDNKVDEDVWEHEKQEGHRIKGGGGRETEGHNVQSMICTCGAVWHKIWLPGSPYPDKWTRLRKTVKPL